MGTRFAPHVSLLALVAAIAVGTAAAATTATVKASQNAKLGTIVVTGSGLTLYHLTGETHGSIKCSGVCAKFWPPLLVNGTGRPLPGAGITASKLATVKRPDGRLQVTYNGLPLYRYALDSKAGQANGEALPGQGVPGTWYAVSAAGAIVKPAAASSISQSTTTTTSGYHY
jgi:predicted lipoprotein with Yx(FWY)xxD motif